MSLTDEDKKWLATLAMIMMNHLAWLIAMGSRAQEDWAVNGSTVTSFKEKLRDRLGVKGVQQ